MKNFAKFYRISLNLINRKQINQNKNRSFYSTQTHTSQTNQLPVWSWNEWDPLEEVLVGIPDYATVPQLLPEVKVCVANASREFFVKNAGRYWADSMSKEHWELLCKQVTELVRVLELEGVKVVRPKAIDHNKTYKILDFTSQGFYAAMPRDFLLIVGNEMIEATMTWRSRYFEYLAYRPLIQDYWKKGAVWTVAPKPTDYSKLIDEKVAAKVDNDTTFGVSLGTITTESEPCFDAADFIRAGRDIFGQRSQVTNLAGIEWLRKHLQPKGIRVHRLTFDDPRPMHIDATFSLVKPGIALQNPDRPCHQVGIIRRAGWDVIDCPYPTVSKDHPFWLGSPWLSMNSLMLDPNRVLVEAEEYGMQEMYKRIGVKPIPVKMRFANSIGGGFHCWTCDIKRKGDLNSYFDWSNIQLPCI